MAKKQDNNQTLPVETPTPAENIVFGTNTPPKEEMMSVPKAQWDNVMNKLQNLDSYIQNIDSKKSTVYNPLQASTEEKIVRLCYYDNLIVVGYKPILRPDKRIVYTFKGKNNLQEERTYITLFLRDNEGTISEKTVDYVEFITSAIPVDTKVKKMTDIGKLVEYGITKQKAWNGDRFIETGYEVMSGAQEQQMEFEVEIEIDGKLEIIHVPQDVVNIK